MVRFSRRQVIGQLAAAAGFGAAFVAEAQPAWRRLKPGAWPVVVAVPDALSIDFAQLLEGFSAREFSVDEAAFGRMLEASAVDAGRLGARVLFGLRGCRLVEGASDPLGRTAPALRLAEAQIDHEDFRCVIGVWVRGEGFWASPASTVPHVSYLHDQRRRVLRGQMDRARTICNQAASGVYKYKVGSHRNWRAEVQPGAFRQASTMAVVRTLDGGELSVRRDRAWAFEGPELGENIHAATPDGDVLYVAAGCQVLPGGYSADRTAPDGNWRAFRVAAGLSAAPGISREIQGETECVQSTDDATPSCAPPFNETLDDLAMGRGVFDYVLVSGRELRMAAEDAGRARDAGARRLRRGSRGAEVARLQAQLNRSRGSGEPALAESGLFDAATQRQLIFAHQLALTGGADGILTRAEGYRLGLSGIFT